MTDSRKIGLVGKKRHLLKVDEEKQTIVKWGQMRRLIMQKPLILVVELRPSQGGKKAGLGSKLVGTGKDVNNSGGEILGRRGGFN